MLQTLMDTISTALETSENFKKFVEFISQKSNFSAMSVCIVVNYIRISFGSSKENMSICAYFFYSFVPIFAISKLRFFNFFEKIIHFEA